MPPDCSIFRYMDSLVGKKNPYKLPNHKDVFASIIKGNYDGSLTRVRTPINRVLENFFKGELSIEEASHISEGITSDCPDSRRYELEILDENTDAVLYALIYQEGRVLSTVGKVPEGAIASILREEGAWEGIPEEVKDLYRRLIKRIAEENKKYSAMEKQREKLQKKKELTIEDIKKLVV